MSDARQRAGDGPVRMAQGLGYQNEHGVSLGFGSSVQPGGVARQIAAPLNAAAEHQREHQREFQQQAEMLGQLGGTGRVLRQAEKSFSRSEILTSLRAIAASKGGIIEAITAFENLE